MLKSRLLYSFIIAILGVFIFLYNHSITFVALYSILLLLAFSFLSILFVRNGLKFSQKLDNTCLVNGEKTIYTLDVENKSIFPCFGIRAIFINNEQAYNFSQYIYNFTLMPYEKTKIEIEVNTFYRGEYELGCSEIIFFDALGLIHLKIKIKLKLEITILPKIIPLEKLILPPVNENSNTQKTIANEDYTEIAELRQYREHDHFKKIHWKMSAKKNELIVKNYNSTIIESAILVLDNTYFSVADIIKEDIIMECFVSVMSYAVTKKYKISYGYFEKDNNYKILSGNNFNELYESAARIKFVSDAANDFDNLMLDLSNNSMNIDAGNIFLFVNIITVSLFESIYRLKTSGYNIILLFLGHSNREPNDLLLRLSEIGIVYYYINDKTKIKQVGS